jgi:hypothetical protein
MALRRLESGDRGLKSKSWEGGPSTVISITWFERRWRNKRSSPVAESGYTITTATLIAGASSFDYMMWDKLDAHESRRDGFALGIRDRYTNTASSKSRPHVEKYSWY